MRVACPMWSPPHTPSSRFWRYANLVRYWRARREILRLGASTPKPELTKARRNGLYQSIAEGGLAPTECDLSIHIEEARWLEIRLTHLPSHSVFELNCDLMGRTESYSIRYVVAAQKESSHPADWHSVKFGVFLWASAVRAEFVDPDLWEELRRERQILEDAHALFDNTPFTSDEQMAISAQLREIKGYLKNAFSLSDDHMSRVEARLNEAEDASHRMGRKDWILLFNGAVFSLILSDLIPPQAAQHILVLALQGLGHLFGIGGLPPDLPPAG